MRILILGNSDVGLYKFRKELLEELVRSNEVFVCVPEGRFTEDVKKIGCNFLPIEIDRRGTNPVKDFSLIRKYDSLMKQVKPDVVLTYTIKPNVYGGIVCQKHRIPYICNITGLGSALESKGLLQNIGIMLYKIGLRKANKVFFQNQSNLDFMIENKIVRNNYDLIPGSGVNTDDYRYIKYPPDGTIGFVYVGRMMKEKGFELYLDCAEYVSKHYDNCQFHVCGEYEENYKDRVDELIERNIIVYHGMVEDMKQIYKDMMCTIHPTYYPEGMSNVLLESLSCGRAIITTDRPGCREIVEEGINGFVVKQNNLEDLIDKTEKFINLDYDSKVQFGKNGREKVKKYFDRSIVIDKYVQELNKL